MALADTHKINEPVEPPVASTRIKITNVLIPWVESEVWNPVWFSPISVGLVSAAFTLAGLLQVSLGLIISYTVWVFYTINKQTRIIFNLVRLLAPSVEKFPHGLDNEVVANLILTQSKVYDASPFSFKKRLRSYLRKIFATGGAANSTDLCSEGHPKLCIHKFDAASTEFWQAVALSL